MVTHIFYIKIYVLSYIENFYFCSDEDSIENEQNYLVYWLQIYFTICYACLYIYIYENFIFAADEDSIENEEDTSDGSEAANDTRTASEESNGESSGNLQNLVEENQDVEGQTKNEL